MSRISLVKGEKREIGTSEKFSVGLSWDLRAGKESDLDVVAIALGDKISNGGKAISEDYVIGYMALNSSNRANLTFKTPTGEDGFKDPEGAILHMGDCRDGSKDGDDEKIELYLNKLNPNVKSIVFAVSIYNESDPNVNFGQVSNASVKLYKGDSDIPELVYDLQEDYSTVKCIEVCEIYVHNGEWKFSSMGDGVTDLSSFLEKYGL